MDLEEKVTEQAIKLREIEKQTYQHSSDIQVLTNTCETISKQIEKLTMTVNKFVDNQFSREKVFLKLENELEEFDKTSQINVELLQRIDRLEQNELKRKKWFGVFWVVVFPSFALLLTGLDWYYSLKYK